MLLHFVDRLFDAILSVTIVNAWRHHIPCRQFRNIAVVCQCSNSKIAVGDHDLSGSKCVCTPPPRDKSNQPAIWAGVLDGTLEVFSSDHSPWHYADKIAGGPGTPFHRIPNGIPGIETRLALLFSAGVNGGLISLQKFADLTAGAPARLFGLHPRKGRIAVGADADIAIWDPDRSVTITNSLLHHATDYTPYEGQVVKGWPIMATPPEGCFPGAARGCAHRPH